MRKCRSLFERAIDTPKVHEEITVFYAWSEFQKTRGTAHTRFPGYDKRWKEGDILTEQRPTLDVQKAWRMVDAADEEREMACVDLRGLGSGDV